MKAYYALEWIDTLISAELNPATAADDPITKTAIETEVQTFLSRLKQRIFKKDEVVGQETIKKYHDALALIIGKNYDYQHDPRRGPAHILCYYVFHRAEHLHGY